jgi:hypothetical protein
LTVGSMIPYIIGASVACAGIHAQDCTSTQQTRFYKIIFAIQFLYLASISSVKVSLLLFYKRAFPNKHFQYVVMITLVLSGMWFIAFSFSLLFEIWPISGNWDFNRKANYSWVINEERMNTWLCGTDVLADIFLLLLPVPMIVSLRMSRKDKFAFLGIFSLGVL